MRRLVKQPLMLWLQLASLLFCHDSLVECRQNITVEPTTAPTASPTNTPTMFPSPITPTQLPSGVPSDLPSAASPSVSLSPSMSPSMTGFPTDAPSTSAPTFTAYPTPVPPLPTTSPSDLPSLVPSESPSDSVHPSASPAPSLKPSDIPSLHPTETTAPSPLPTEIPSVSPSLTAMPSASPSLSLRPSKSPGPSQVPSLVPSMIPSDLPSSGPSSNAPSGTPTFGPTDLPSIYPTNMPTSVPSSAPTVTLMDISKAVIEIMFVNMPILTSDSDIFIWEEITSAHVIQYWEKQPLPAVIVQQASTDLLQQKEEVMRQRRTQTSTASNRVNYFYSQNLTYGTLRPNTLIEDEIFTRPFDRDESAYTISLLSALNLPLETDLTIADIIVIEDGTPVPSPAPIVPTIPPVNVPSDGSGISTTVTAVVVIMALLVFLGTMAAAYNYYRRSKEQRNHEAWASEQQRAEQERDDEAYGMRDTPTQISIQPSNQYQHQTSSGVGGAFPSSDDDSEIEPYSVAAGSNLMNEDGDESFPVRDEYYGPLAFGDSSQHEPPTSNLLGGEYDSDEENELNEGEQLMPAPLDGLGRVSSYGSSVDEGPSMSAFNVMVTDIDDEIDEISNT
jgi:hypothetical protein